MIRKVLLLLFVLGLAVPALGVERFPPPDFQSDYQIPSPTTPNPRSTTWEWVDVGVLIATLLLGSYFALKLRSRLAIFLLVLFSLAYFGFFRKGCVCPIGAIQNVSLSLWDATYILPIGIVLFFLLPLAFTLLFGRSFCGSVCPLGAVQDVVLVKPVKVPRWLEHGLGLIAWVYLAAAILFAATGALFIICLYDPFVAIFRFSGATAVLIIGAVLIGLSLFVGRPYCRFLCPLGAMFRVIGRFSAKRVTITPDQCIRCRLCEDACPFGAIDAPNDEDQPTSRLEGKGMLIAMLLLLPVLVVGVGFGASLLRDPFAKVHPRVQLAERVWLEEQGRVQGLTDASEAFRKGAVSTTELYAQAAELREDFYWGAWMAGGLVGLVIGLKLIELSIHRTRTEYEANRSLCVACGRCFRYCPVEQKRRRDKKREKSKT